MRIYESQYVIPGLIVFLAIATFPFWARFVMGGQAAYPYSKESPAGRQCLLEKSQMRSDHMQMLVEWRDEVVRDGDRTPQETLDGVVVEKSLTNGCMKCHAKEDVTIDGVEYKSVATYCLDCHDYVGVDAYCWECHVDPK